VEWRSMSFLVIKNSWYQLSNVEQIILLFRHDIVALSD